MRANVLNMFAAVAVICLMMTGKSFAEIITESRGIYISGGVAGSDGGHEVNIEYCLKGGDDTRRLYLGAYVKVIGDNGREKNGQNYEVMAGSLGFLGFYEFLGRVTDGGFINLYIGPGVALGYAFSEWEYQMIDSVSNGDNAALDNNKNKSNSILLGLMANIGMEFNFSAFWRRGKKSESVVLGINMRPALNLTLAKKFPLTTLTVGVYMGRTF